MEKILLVAQEGLNKGGVQTVIMSIVKNLHHKYKFDIILFTNEVRYYDNEFESFGGKIFRISFFKSRNVFMRRIEKFLRKTLGYFMIKRIIKKNGPYKAVHCHNSIESPTALAAAKACNIRSRVNQIHVVFNDSGASAYLRKQHAISKYKMKSLATACIGCSDLACKSFFSSDYKVILNPYDDGKFQANGIGMKFDSPQLIQVGNFSNLKNQLFSINVFHEIQKIYPNSHLTFVGHDDGGRYLQRMEELISKLNIKDKVSILPADSDIPRLMQCASYLLMPSRTESFGIVLVEAQAMGLMCYASDVIPKEPNAGGCMFRSINEEPKIWAQHIIANFRRTKGFHQSYNMDSYKGKEIANQIEKLYTL